MKYVSLIRSQKHGKETWRLLGPDGTPVFAMEAFAISLLKKSINTRATYCRHLAEFFDYLFEVAAQRSEVSGSGLQFTRATLISAMEGYDDYLVLGENSGIDLVRDVDKALPSPRVSTKSSALKHAALRSFLRLSERIREQLKELEPFGISQHRVDQIPLMPGIGERRELTRFERTALLGRSLIAGVVAGGSRFIADEFLRTGQGASEYKHNRAFPFDKVVDLIEALPTRRDRALYSFCAASGCRISEALQLLWEDIDLSARTVVLIDPNGRRSHPAYIELSPAERDRLVWKGRQLPETLLIEPFVGIFFRELEAYLREEYVPLGELNFVFQYGPGTRHGRPYFLSKASSRNQLLQRAMKKCDLGEAFGSGGPHSFRHMYGTYLLNYFPNSDGTYGLPLAVVQQLMGHADPKSTQKYARHDMDLIRIELAYANTMVMQGGEAKSLNQLKLEALREKILLLERIVAQEPQRLQSR